MQREEGSGRKMIKDKREILKEEKAKKRVEVQKREGGKDKEREAVKGGKKHLNSKRRRKKISPEEKS